MANVKVWYYFERRFDCIDVQNKQCVLDLLKKILLRAEYKSVKEAYKSVEEERKSVKAQTEDGKKRSADRLVTLDNHLVTLDNRLVSLDNRLVSLLQSLRDNDFSSITVDASDYEFSSASKEISASEVLTNLGQTEAEAIYIIEKIKAPRAKRPKTLNASAVPPHCSKAPSELANNKLENDEAVPAYYHWIALELQELFAGDLGLEFSLGNVRIEVPKRALDQLIVQLDEVYKGCSSENEYAIAALFCRALDRFLFQDDKVHCGACLSQYPLEGTRRGDLSIVKFQKWLPSLPLLASNDSKAKLEDFLKAERETRCYTICGLSKTDHKFPYNFGIPYCPSKVALELHIIVGGKIQYIHVAEAELSNIPKVEKFFVLLYGAIHWLLVKEQPKADVPSGPRPTENLELCEKFEYGQNVFLKDGKVYKLYDSNDSRIPNEDMLKTLEYMSEVECKKLNHQFTLLSYKYLAGDKEPKVLEQFYSLGKILQKLHSQEIVHGDVRFSNLVFGPGNSAYLIDFDFASKKGNSYPDTYNGQLDERHEAAQRGQARQVSHDEYSLIYILYYYFPLTTKSGIKDRYLAEMFSNHEVAVKWQQQRNVN